MKPPIAKRLLTLTCALFMTWAVSSSIDAGQFYSSAGYGPAPYYAGYAPTSYYTGYGPTSYYAAYGPSRYYAGYAPRYVGYRAYRGNPYRARYRVGYVGYTPWSASYASFYVASHCGSGCNSVCNPCGGCGSCGVNYGACGTSCDPCGYSSCGGYGIACGDCSTGDCGTGISGTGSSGTGSSGDRTDQPPNDPYRGPGSGQQTYEDDGTEGDFAKPAVPEGTGDGGSEVLPGGSGTRDPFDQEANKPADEKIHQRKDAVPAEAEPDAEKDAPPAPPQPGADVQPLGIDSQIAAGTIPERVRVRYAVRFHAPRIARVDVSPNSRWTPVDVDTKLAVSRP